MNTVPPNDFSYFEMINDLVQKEPVGALDPEIMGSLAAIGIVKGKPFNPDARMKKILTDAAAIGTAAARTVELACAPGRGVTTIPTPPGWNPLFVGGYNFETPPPEVSADGIITVNPPTGARTLNVAHVMFFFYATFITPAMIMRLTDIGSQYLGAFVDSKGEYFDGSKTYKVTLPKDIPGGEVLVLHRLRQPDALDARHPAALSARRQPELSDARRRSRTPTARRPSISVRPSPTASSAGNWIQTDPKQGLVHDPAPLQPARTVLHQGVAAERDRVGEVVERRCIVPVKGARHETHNLQPSGWCWCWPLPCRQWDRCPRRR